MNWSPEVRVALCFGLALLGAVATILFIIYTAYQQGMW
jgi:hypothetical protein